MINLGPTRSANTFEGADLRSVAQRVNQYPQEFLPLHNVCEFLNALHVYTDEAREGVIRYVEANHYCSHVRKGELDRL